MTLPNVHLCTHPLVRHDVSVLRAKRTPSDQFRHALERISRVLVLKATEFLPMATYSIETPLCDTEAEFLDKSVSVVLVPILRAGLGLLNGALEWLPNASVHHVGLFRDETTCQPVHYYNKLPDKFTNPEAQFFILDPMLATGGSAVDVIALLTQRGVSESNIHFVCVIAAPEGIKNLHAHYPDVKITTAGVDERLNEQSYILPGLGDAGDRMFKTVH